MAYLLLLAERLLPETVWKTDNNFLSYEFFQVQSSNYPTCMQIAIFGKQPARKPNRTLEATSEQKLPNLITLLTRYLLFLSHAYLSQNTILCR